MKKQIKAVNIIKILPYIVNTIFVLICFIHVSTIISKSINPEETSSRVYKKNVQEIEFPLEFLLCVNQENEKEKYRQVGYPDNGYFFRGFLNDTVTGWGGRSANGTSYGSVEG